MEKQVKLPRVIRHNQSGVWICYILGKGDFEDTILIRGRRIWQWRGGRLETTGIAMRGCREEDRLGHVVETSLPVGPNSQLVDCIRSTSAIVDAAFKLKADDERK